MVSWVFTKGRSEPQMWSYEWVDRMLRAEFKDVAWRTLDYGNELIVSVKNAAGKKSWMGVEFFYSGGREIGHFEPVTPEPGEETMWDILDDNGKPWIWVTDVPDSRKWSLIMQEDPEALVCAFIELAKAGGRVRG